MLMVENSLHKAEGLQSNVFHKFKTDIHNREFSDNPTDFF